MGGDEAVFRGEEWIICARGFGREDVEGGTGDLVGVQGIGQVLVYDELAAAGIDENCRRLHQCEGSLIDQAFGFGAQRHVERNEV